MKMLLAATAFVALCGCQYDPHARDYTIKEPALAEVVGDYELDQIYMETYSTGIRDKVSKLDAPPVIRLLADESFIAERFPYFLKTNTGFEFKFEDFRTLNAKWSQSPVGSISDGSDNTKTHYGIIVEGLPTHLSSIGFTGRNKVDGLIIGFGDPDSGDAIKYKKKITEQAASSNR